MNDALPFNGNNSIRDEIWRLARKHGIGTCFETGTGSGVTTLELAKIFTKVFTVESDEATFKATTEKLDVALRDSPHHWVKQALGSSPEFIMEEAIRLHPDKPVLFYLNARATGQNRPILGELKAISEYFSQPVIVIQLGDLDFAFIQDHIGKIYRHGYDYHYDGQDETVIYIEPKS